jgi:hypothetical protein
MSESETSEGILEVETDVEEARQKDTMNQTDILDRCDTRNIMFLFNN